MGSCIAIVLWHPILRVGGMCHFVLPERHGAPEASPNGRYAVEAMALFQRGVRGVNTTMKEYHGMIYGGANVVASLAGSGEEDTIGMRNAGCAMELLQQHGVTVMVADVGETWARRISFDMSSGEVEVKR